MIQYSNINDAWGNKEIFKKKVLNNYVEKPADIKPSEIPQSNKPIKHEQIITTTITNPNSNSNPITNNPINNPINNGNLNEHFKACSFAEHFKQCESCRNSMIEQFNNSNKAKVNIFGMKFLISREILKIIFIILIVLIFMILLSLVNLPIKEEIRITPAHMKYLMMNQMQYHPTNPLNFY